MQGANSGVREADDNGGGPGSVTLTTNTSSAVLSTDIGIYFGATGITTGGTMSISVGTVLQTPSIANLVLGITAWEPEPGGVRTVSFVCTDVAPSAVSVLVIVKGTTAVPVDFPITSGAPSTTPTLGTAYFDPTTNDLWIYGSAGWKSVLLT